MTAEFVQVKIRCRKSLRKRLEKLAAENERSVNAEMVARLEESIQISIERRRHKEIISRLDTIENIVKGDIF